jgi:hypothetical protein
MKNTRFIEPVYSDQCNRLRSGPHSRSIAIGWIISALAILLASCEPGPTPTEPAEYGSWDTVPVHFSNLQVLPETIARDELIEYMRTISRSLGVRCSHCHRKKTEDYAADDVEAKLIARDMMRLVQEFNELIPEQANSTAVTCDMCHRGSTKPPSAEFSLPHEAL